MMVDENDMKRMKLATFGRQELPEGFDFEIREEAPASGSDTRPAARPAGDPDHDTERDRARKRPAKPPTETRLRNVAEYYVSQREASRQMVRDRRCCANQRWG